MTDLQSSQDKSATQLLQLQKSLKQSQQGKRISVPYKYLILILYRHPEFSHDFSGKKEMSEKLCEAQRSLSLQEEVFHHAETEKRSLGKDVGRLRTSLQTAQAESKALQVKVKEIKQCTPFSVAADKILCQSLHRISWSSCRAQNLV